MMKANGTIEVEAIEKRTGEIKSRRRRRCRKTAKQLYVEYAGSGDWCRHDLATGLQIRSDVWAKYEHRALINTYMA